MTEEEFRTAVLEEIHVALAAWGREQEEVRQSAEAWTQVLRKYAPFGGILENLANTWY